LDFFGVERFNALNTKCNSEEFASKVFKVYLLATFKLFNEVCGG